MSYSHANLETLRELVEAVITILGILNIIFFEETDLHYSEKYHHGSRNCEVALKKWWVYSSYTNFPIRFMHGWVAELEKLNI